MRKLLLILLTLYYRSGLFDLAEWPFKMFANIAFAIKQKILFNRFLETTEGTAEGFEQILFRKGYAPDYTFPIKRAFCVVFGNQCRGFLGVEVYGELNPSIPVYDMDFNVRAILSEFNLTDEEICILYSSVTDAMSALEKTTVPLPDRDACLEMWEDLFRGMNMPREITRLYSGELQVQEKPNFFEQLSVVGFHLFDMTHIASVFFEKHRLPAKVIQDTIPKCWELEQDSEPF